MHLALLLLAQAQPANDGGGGGAPGPLGGLGSFMPIVLMVVLGYFLLMRPMQRQEKQRQALVAAVKKNDRIINSGGIIGIVDSVKDEEVVLRGGLRITRSSIARILSAEEAPREQKEGGA